MHMSRESISWLLVGLTSLIVFIETEALRTYLSVEEDYAVIVEMTAPVG
jgi:hypothetical protein